MTCVARFLSFGQPRLELLGVMDEDMADVIGEAGKALANAPLFNNFGHK